MKIVIIGNMGHAGQAFEEMRRCPEAEFVGAAPGSRYEDPRDLACFGCPVFDSWQELLDRTKPDVAVLSPVFGLTAPIAEACAIRGIDVFSEKPVASTLEELDRLEQVIRNSGIHFSAMHFLRYTPSFYHAQKLVQAGAIGEVRMLTAQKSYKFGSRPAWFSDRKLYTGTIPWVGIHAIDWIRFFSGKRMKTVRGLQWGNPELAALVQLELEDGVFASANIDYLRPQPAGTHGDDRIRVAGTEGVMEVFSDRYVLLDGTGEHRAFPTEAPKLAEEFLHRREQLPVEEIFEVTRAALTARDSADCGKILEIR